jgi:hypothetical protein
VASVPGIGVVVVAIMTCACGGGHTHPTDSAGTPRDATGDGTSDGPRPLACKGLTDTAIHAPPTAGAFGYAPPGSFMPGNAGFPARGGSYVDPVFGCTVRRLTDVLPGWGSSLIYSKNGFWNANGSRYASNPNEHGEVDIVDGETGDVVRASVPFGVDGSFDPVDPNVFYSWDAQSANLQRYDVTTGQRTTIATFSAPLDTLGGSVDWIDRTGRYFLVSFGGALHVWDKQTATMYAGSVPANFGSGWAGLSPDGSYIIVGGYGGQEFQHWSFVVDHAHQQIAGSGIMFWSLCGPHSDVITASDGKTYLVGFDCTDVESGYRVDVTIPQPTGDVAKQKSDNVQLCANDFMDAGHFACAASGDWCFAEISSGDDTFADMGAWRPYKQEILALQVVPPYEVRRLAHHRSRSPFSDYTRQPRVNASWDGRKIAYASDYGYQGNGPAVYSDVYYIDLR